MIKNKFIENIAFINHYSGKLNSEYYSTNLLFSLLESKIPFTVFGSKYPGHIIDLLIEYQNSLKNLLLIGGDGTLNEALQFLAHSFEKKIAVPKLLYLPSGTTCDFANNLNFTSDYSTWLKQFNENKLKEEFLDTCIFNSPSTFIKKNPLNENKRYFAYVAACGALTGVPYTTSVESKKSLGYLAYVLNGIREIPFLQGYEVEINLDGKIFYERILFLAISNSFSIAGLIKMDQNYVSLKDGYFEIIILRDSDYTILRPARLASLAIDTTPSEQLLILKGRKLSLKFKEELPFTLDGEFAGNHHSVDIEVLPKSLNLYTRGETL